MFQIFSNSAFEACCIHIDIFICLFIHFYFVTLFIAVAISQLKYVKLVVKICQPADVSLANQTTKKNFS